MGEFNVNKSDGSLEQTAGMPSEYPATQVMMSDGVTSVEDALDKALAKLDYAHAESITSLPYTATKDGVAFITVGKVASPDVALREFSVNGVYVGSSSCFKISGSSSVFYNTCQIPLSVGDQLTSPYSVYGTYIFVPYATT